MKVQPMTEEVIRRMPTITLKQVLRRYQGETEHDTNIREVIEDELSKRTHG